MLAYHPDLSWLSQFSLRRGQIPGRRRRPVAGRLDSVLRVLPHPWRKESTRLRHWLVPQPGEEAAIWAYLLEDEETSPDRVRSHLVAFSEAHGGRRLLAKRPDFYRHLGLLKAAFPDARFVHIVRDGRPVALSLRAKELAVAELNGQQGDPGDALLAAARFWTRVLEHAAKLSPAELIEVRYEDFCSDVHGTLGTILRHAWISSPTRFPSAAVRQRSRAGTRIGSSALPPTSLQGSRRSRWTS